MWNLSVPALQTFLPFQQCPALLVWMSGSKQERQKIMVERGWSAGCIIRAKHCERSKQGIKKGCAWWPIWSSFLNDKYPILSSFSPQSAPFVEQAFPPPPTRTETFPLDLNLIWFGINASYDKLVWNLSLKPKHRTTRLARQGCRQWEMVYPGMWLLAGMPASLGTVFLPCFPQTWWSPPVDYDHLGLVSPLYAGSEFGNHRLWPF